MTTEQQLLLLAGRLLESQSPDWGDVDGASIEEWLIEAGLLKQVDVTEECDSENCVCAEFGFPSKCNRRTELGERAERLLAERGGGDAMSGDEAVRKESAAKQLFEKLDEIARDQCAYDFGLSYSDVPMAKSLDAIMAYGQASRSAAMSRMEEFLQKLAWTKEDIEAWRNWMSH